MTRIFETAIPPVHSGVLVREGDGPPVHICFAVNLTWAHTIIAALNACEGNRRAIAAELAEAMNGIGIAPHFEVPPQAASKGEGSIAQGILAADGMSTTVTYQTLREANLARQALWCPEQVPDLSFRGNELAGETGEACNVIKKLERERHGWRGSRATTAELASELADVVIGADLCAISSGIDLDEAVEAKFNATSEKVGLPVRYTRLAKAPQWNPPLEWRWYHGTAEDADIFFGGFATREEAIDAGRNELDHNDADLDENHRWTASFYVVEASKEPLRLSRYFDVDFMIDRAEENADEDEERVGEDDHGQEFFKATRQQIADLGARIERVCDEWQTENAIFYRPWMFSHTRNGETITVDFTKDRAAALAAMEAAQAADPLGSASSASEAKLDDEPLPGLAG